MGTQWQDASTVWHTGFDGDISLNNLISYQSYSLYSQGYSGGNSLVYDESNNRIYSGGIYVSTFIDNSQCFAPFVAWSNDGGINWQDASAIWQGGTGAFDNDICFNSISYTAINQVSALAYDESNNRIYAGGLYNSIENSGNLVPFVCWSNDGINWQDASAIWQEGTGAFDGDISFNSNQGISFVSSLLSCNNRIYAGGSYSSIENSGNLVPFVCSTSDGINWQDASALWHSNAFDGDISLNGSSLVSSLAYDSNYNRIYAGGRYTNNSGNNAPFVCWSNDGGINWQDASAIWQNGFDGDISLNNNNNSVFSLAYNTINNRIYAGGTYSSIENSGNLAPFVCSSSDGINWQDASAIWQPLSGAFNSDICFNNIYGLNSVNSLTYDNQGFIYAGGMYSSIRNRGNVVPFVSSSSDGIHWQDSTAILQGFDGDIDLRTLRSPIQNINLVTSLLYEPSHNRLYANGYYTSRENDLTTLPFVANGEPANPPPYYSIEFTDTVLFLNGRNSGLTTQTYYLNLADMSSNVTVTNNLSGGQVGTVKLWVDNSSQTANNVPPGQFIIDGSNITIDGQCTELDLSAETNYTGLVSSVANNSTGIIIENININLGTNPAASLSTAGNSGWVCHGNMNGVDINFMNCQVNAGGDLFVNNGIGANGGICGGGINNTSTLSFADCKVSAIGDLYVNNGTGLGIGANGGICGGAINNTSTLSFINCTVNAGGDLYVNNGDIDYGGGNGGICGGGINNTSTLSFADCKVSAIGDLYVNNEGVSGNGGICGGNNNTSTLSFINCTVNAGSDLYVNGNGGIYGGNSNTSTLSFINCTVNAGSDLYVNNGTGGFGINGGICGGNNNTSTLSFINCTVNAGSDLYVDNNGNVLGFGANGGICGGINTNITINFTNCQVQSNNDILITTPTNTSAGICGGGNDATGANFNFFLCFVRPGTNNGFSYNGTPITAPNNDRVTLKTKLMIAGQSITNQNQIQIDCVSQLIAVPDYSCNTEPLPPVPPVPPTPAPAPTSNISPLGGGFQGFEPKMVVLVEGGGGRSMTRRILRDAFGTGANNKTRKCTTPFRISVNESCAGKPGKAAVIYSGSDYIRFKKLVAVNKNYNDSSFGGDNNNGSYDALKRARH
jgi:hypothetical protein